MSNSPETRAAVDDMQDPPAFPASTHRTRARRRLRRTLGTAVTAFAAAAVLNLSTATPASATDIRISGESVWTYTGWFLDENGWVVYRFTGYGITALCYENGACSFWPWR